MKTSFYDKQELESIGLKSYGENVFISRNARFYGPEKISIGSNVRIDDFCILSGNIEIGNYVHISSSTTLTGGVAGIVLKDFSNISQRVNIFANSDDYSGETMSNPMVPDEHKKLDQRPVFIGRHVIIACGSVILPGVTFGDGAVLGALSLARKNVPDWEIHAGVPAKFLKTRSKNLLRLEEHFFKSL